MWALCLWGVSVELVRELSELLSLEKKVCRSAVCELRDSDRRGVLPEELLPLVYVSSVNTDNTLVN